MSQNPRLRRTLTLRITGMAVMAACCCLATCPGWSQDPDQAERDRVIKLYSSIQWQKGPTKGQLGQQAEIQIPEGYQFAGQAGAAIWMEISQNPPDPSLLGVMTPIDGVGEWFLTFSFSDIGYVKDDEKSQLDANAIVAKNSPKKCGL